MAQAAEENERLIKLMEDMAPREELTRSKKDLKVAREAAEALRGELASSKAACDDAKQAILTLKEEAHNLHAKMLEMAPRCMTQTSSSTSRLFKTTHLVALRISDLTPNPHVRSEVASARAAASQSKALADDLSAKMRDMVCPSPTSLNSQRCPHCLSGHQPCARHRDDRDD